MAKTIHSANLTFIDLTDSKKVDVHITSNLPTVQIFDGNENAQTPYSPDWTNTPLVLELTAYADSTNITSALKESDIDWYRQVGSGGYQHIQDGGTKLTISQNELNGIGQSAGVISYICSIKYNEKTFEGKTTFARIDTGLNGAAGADGTSVKILGTAKSVKQEENNSYYTITYDDGVVKAAEIGDAYIFQGELYVCSVLNGGEDGSTDYFINVGSIQGPAGKDGTDAKVLLLNGTSQVFKFGANSTTPSPSTIKVTAQRINIPTDTELTWYYNGSTKIPDGVSNNGDVVTITGSALTTSSLIIKVTDGNVEDIFTVYKAFDGIQGAPAPLVFLTNENITFPADEHGQITGSTVFQTKVVGYVGDKKVLPELRINDDDTINFLGGLPSYLTASYQISDTDIIVQFTIQDKTLGSTSNTSGEILIPITSPVNISLPLNWSKVNAGQQGIQGDKGVDAYTVLLTNESHVFAGDVSNAIAGTAETQALAYIGATQQKVKILEVNNQAASIIDTDVNDIPGLKFKCDTVGESDSPKITFTCTTAFKGESNGSGTIPIKLSVGDVEFTKMFAYSIAFKGATGNTGSQGVQGQAATSYWLISSASAVQKTSTGTITVTPSTLTFAGKSKTGTNAPVDYACRWIIDYSTDGTTYTNLYTSTANEVSKSITVATTYKTIRARMYMAGGTTALLDEQIIPIVSDGAKGDKGDQGIQGIQGPKGEQGIQGPQGTNGKSSYFHIKYSVNSNGNPMTETPSTYIGTYVDDIEADSSDYTKYTWSRFEGAQGPKGDQGIAGTNGTNGQTSYLHIAYATSANGSSGFSVTDSVGKTYIGQYTDYTQADSTDYTKYKWTLIKGDKGNQGDRGAGISSVTVTYGTSTSASTQPTSWQTTLPTVAEGSYLWTRTVTDYTDASIADTVTLTYAKQGAKGSTGSAGTSVTVSSIQYQAGTSATTAPTGTWSNSVVTVAEGSYLWTKTTFSDGKVAYGVAKQGAKGSAGVNAITFQIYATNGYLLSNELDSLTLQTFAYDGSTAITNATYAWSYQENDAWVTLTDKTTSSLTLTQDDVIKSKTYRCAMTYKNTTYYATATVQDKTDIYDVMICVSDNINPLTGIYYWVVYALLYSEQGEADALLGPISTTAPESPASGDYWYSVDAATQKVTLKKYNGSTWVASTDKQAYAYDWRQIVDGTQQQAIGNTDKVQIISCNSFTSNATFQCIVTDTDGSKLARCNIHLTDTSDPIISAAAPVGVKDGQLWMQTQTDGTFLLYIWDADTSIWKQLNADTKNVVHTTKPSSYKAGDLWVVESDTAISGYTKGTLLQSNATTTTFAAAHWTPSLKYESELSEVQNALKSYKQYMTVDSKGLHMQAKNADGTLSPFQALFTNTRLSFYQDDLEVAYISDNKLNIYEANIDVLSVEKKIQLQKFEWAIESNGSMSLIVNY